MAELAEVGVFQKLEARADWEWETYERKVDLPQSESPRSSIMIVGGSSID